MVQSLVSKDEYFWPSINVPKRDVFNVVCGISRTTCLTFFLVSSAKYQDSPLPWIASCDFDSVCGGEACWTGLAGIGVGAGAGLGAAGAGGGVDALVCGVGLALVPPNSFVQMLMFCFQLCCLYRALDCGLTKKAEPPPTNDVNRDSGTDSANGGWLRRLVRRHGRHAQNLSANRKLASQLVRRASQPENWRRRSSARRRNSSEGRRNLSEGRRNSSEGRRNSSEGRRKSSEGRRRPEKAVAGRPKPVAGRKMVISMLMV